MCYPWSPENVLSQCQKMFLSLSDTLFTWSKSVNGKQTPDPGEIMIQKDKKTCYETKNTLHHHFHYCDVKMGAIGASPITQITRVTIVYSTVHSGADQRKHQSSAWLGFVRGIHRWPVNSPHKRPVTQEMFPFDDVNMVHNKEDSCQ